MSDASYTPKVYIKQGGDEIVIAPGGTLRNQGEGYRKQGSPNTQTTVATLTIANLLTKLINATPTATGATVAYTLPIGSLVEAGVTMEADDSFDWVLINNALAAADTITLTASSGHTIVGNPVVQSLHASTGATMGYSSMWRTRKVSDSVYVTYRIA